MTTEQCDDVKVASRSGCKTPYSNMQHKPRPQYPGDKWGTVNQLWQDVRREGQVLKVFSSQITFSQDRRKRNSCHLCLTVRKETDIQPGPTSSVWVNSIFFPVSSDWWAKRKQEKIKWFDFVQNIYSGDCNQPQLVFVTRQNCSLGFSLHSGLTTYIFTYCTIFHSVCDSRSRCKGPCQSQTWTFIMLFMAMLGISHH